VGGGQFSGWPPFFLPENLDGSRLRNRPEILNPLSKAQGTLQKSINGIILEGEELILGIL
jgi:hypothetical protein